MFEWREIKIEVMEGEREGGVGGGGTEVYVWTNGVLCIFLEIVALGIACNCLSFTLITITNQSLNSDFTQLPKVVNSFHAFSFSKK